MLTTTSTQSLTEQLADRFAERIRNRLLAPGARLPSVRECARQQGVSPPRWWRPTTSCWRRAWSRRAASAASSCAMPRRTQPRAQRVQRAQPTCRTPPPAQPPRAPAPVDATHADPRHVPRPSDKPQPGMGVFPPDWLESTFMPAAVRKVTSAKALQRVLAAVRRARGRRRPAPQPGRASWRASTCRPRRSRSSPPWAPRMRWTSSAARCCAPATR